MCADVVIVGGGPVGCWTAIQLKKRDPGLDVLVYERFEEYQRANVLRLRQSAFLFYSKRDHDARERAFFEEITGKPGMRDVLGAAAQRKSVFIRTLDLETALKDYCLDLGVRVACEKIESAKGLMERHPECKYFIGADGAHSRMRMEILGEDSVENKDLQPVVDVKYKVSGEARAAGGYTESLQRIDTADFITAEYVGEIKDGVTPVTVRFLVDRDTYDAIPGATFKEPLRVDDPRLPAKLGKDIRDYLRFRREQGLEEGMEEPAAITKVMLSAYAAKKFATEHKADGCEATWFFVGDAALGVPFSVNAGIIMGSQLGLILSRRKVAASLKVKAFNALRPLDIAWEFGLAKTKNAAVAGVYKKIRPLLRHVPHRKTNP